MNARAIWDFVAGESRLAPIGVAVAVVVAILLQRYMPDNGAVTGGVFVALLIVGLIAGVMEKV